MKLKKLMEAITEFREARSSGGVPGKEEGDKLRVALKNLEVACDELEDDPSWETWPPELIQESIELFTEVRDLMGRGISDMDRAMDSMMDRILEVRKKKGLNNIEPAP